MSLFLASLVRGNASDVSESTRVNFKPCWCLSHAVNDKENPRKLNPGCDTPSIRSTSGSRKTRTKTCKCSSVRIASLHATFSFVLTDWKMQISIHSFFCFIILFLHPCVLHCKVGKLAPVRRYFAFFSKRTFALRKTNLLFKHKLLLLM